MNIRVIAASLAIAATLVVGTAAAQQQRGVAKLADLEGYVLVSQGDAMVAGANGQRLTVGTRVVTTAGAKVTIDYDVGCDVRLKENERFTVRLGECPILLTEVVPLGPAAGAIGVTATTPILGVLGLGAAGGAYEIFKQKCVSPS